MSALACTLGISGLSLITASEGLRNYAYKDAVGITTICYGHTGPDVKMGQHRDDAECAQTLLRDVRAAQAYIVPASPSACLAGAPISPNQRDALTSFVFNVGGPKFCKSTMAAKLRKRDYAGASGEFPRWVHGSINGKPVVLRGLVTRRKAEQALFLTQDRYTPAHVLSPRVLTLVSE